MKSRASYFSISIPLIKENLRRFWAIPAIGFLAYFLSSSFPILMSYDNLNNMYGYIKMCLTNLQPFFMATHLIMPIITAVIIFRYIQSSSSVTALHSMPFTRAQLYNSNILSGLILIIVPLLANEIILQIIAKPTYDNYMYIHNESMSTILSSDAINIFTRSNVLQWFWQSLIIVLVIYAIAVFAGMVTGNVVMHLSLAFGFNFLAPALYATFIAYCSSYLYGYTSTGAHENILISLSPFTKIFDSTGNFSIPLQIYYVLSVILILVVSYVLYLNRKMEKTGDSLIFNFMIPTICYLISYFGMTLMGYYFKSLNDNELNSELYFYAGLAAGAIIFFAIGRMIVLKTPRIFNKYSLKSFTVFTILAVLFISTITLDLTGFENRVPNINKVNEISLSRFDFTNNEIRFRPYLYRNKNFKDEYNAFYFSNPQNIEAFIGLHQDIVKNKKQIQNEDNDDKKRYTISFNYDISNPLGLTRRYSLGYDRISNNKYLKQIYESSEFKKYFSFTNLKYKRITNMRLNNEKFYNGEDFLNLIIADKNKINELINAMEQDFQDSTYEEYLDRKHPYCNIALNYKHLDANEKLVEDTLEFDILLSDSNTIKWLKDNDYSQYIEITADMIDNIGFFNSGYNGSIDTIDAKSQRTIKEDKYPLTITDKNQIQEILNTYSTDNNNYDNYYQGSITFNKNIVDSYEKSIYYDADTAPSFIADYFK